MSNFRRPVYAKPMIYTTLTPKNEERSDQPMLRSERRDLSLSRLIRAGTEILCEHSYASMGVEQVLQRAGQLKENRAVVARPRSDRVFELAEGDVVGRVTCAD